MSGSRGGDGRAPVRRRGAGELAAPRPLCRMCTCDSDRRSACRGHERELCDCPPTAYRTSSVPRSTVRMRRSRGTSISISSSSSAAKTIPARAMSPGRIRPLRPPRRDLRATPRTASAARRAMTKPTAGHRCRALERRRCCSWRRGWRRSAPASPRCSWPAVGAAMRKPASRSAETQPLRFPHLNHFPSWQVIDTLTSAAADDS